MRYLIQDGLVPPLHPEEASGIITRSEQILKEYAKKASLTDKDIISLIQDVLQNPEFNADDVDTDMLKRFMDSIDSGDLTVANLSHSRQLLSCMQKNGIPMLYQPALSWLPPSFQHFMSARWKTFLAGSH